MEYYCNIYCNPRQDYFLKIDQLFKNDNNDGKGVYNFTGTDSCTTKNFVRSRFLKKIFVFFFTEKGISEILWQRNETSTRNESEKAKVSPSFVTEIFESCENTKETHFDKVPDDDDLRWINRIYSLAENQLLPIKLRRVFRLMLWSQSRIGRYWQAIDLIV